MKLIAHRGGSFGKENSLETIIASAKIGADAVECDIRKTKDGIYVIYHDENLSRLADTPVTVSEITFEEMQRIFSNTGQKVLTFDELAKGYREEAPILLHIKLKEYNKDLAKYVVDSGLPLIAGVMSVPMLSCFTPLLPPEKILAFMPTPDSAKEFYENGAGIIRLWEQWLNRKTPKDIKLLCPNVQVYIMACNLSREPWSGIPLDSMDGSIDSLKKCSASGADGILLNDIEMAINWRKQNKER